MKRRLFLSGSAAGALGLVGCGGGGGGAAAELAPGVGAEAASAVGVSSGASVAAAAAPAPAVQEAAAPEAVVQEAAAQEPAAQAAVASALPRRVLSCCYTTWDTGRYRITDVPMDFNVITLFHAKPNGQPVNGNWNNVGNGSFFFEHYGDVAVSDIQACRKRGQRVLLTVGGAAAGFNFNTRDKSRNFVASYREMYDRLGGFDGCEFNNFEANIGSSPTEMVWIAEQLKGLYGRDFAITAPPNPNSAEDMALMKAMNDAGVLTWCGPQYYDWFGFNEVGFIRNRTADWVRLLGEDKVALGLTANYGNGPSLQDCIREWDAVKAAFPNIRGMYCWNAQLNLAGGNVWGSTMKARLA